MAKIKLGPMVGQASGSIAATTFSHNRYGAYVRNRAIPIKSTTSYAQASKARLTEASQAWASLTDAQRLAWKNWALANPITDVLGEKQELDGHAAYVQLNTRMLAAGLTKLTAPPLVAAPAPLTTLTGSWDIGAGTFALAFTPTPLGASKSVWLMGAVVNNPAINYVKNLLRLITVSSANQTTGWDTQSVLEARLGAVSVGQKVIYFASVFDRTTGLLSAPLRVEGTIVTT